MQQGLGKLLQKQGKRQKRFYKTLNSFSVNRPTKSQRRLRSRQKEQRKEQWYQKPNTYRKNSIFLSTDKRCTFMSYPRKSEDPADTEEYLRLR